MSHIKALGGLPAVLLCKGCNTIISDTLELRGEAVELSAYIVNGKASNASGPSDVLEQSHACARRCHPADGSRLCLRPQALTTRPSTASSSRCTCPQATRGVSQALASAASVTGPAWSHSQRIVSHSAVLTKGVMHCRTYTSVVCGTCGTAVGRCYQALEQGLEHLQSAFLLDASAVHR